MSYTTTKKLELAASHLNASVGALVSTEALAQSLRDGTVRNVRVGPRTARVRGLLHSVFVEVEPQLLLDCVREAGATWRSADLLYQESLRAGAYKSRAWEELVRAWT